MSLAAMQLIFEDMLFDEAVLEHIFSSDGQRFAREAGLTCNEFQMLLAPGAAIYSRARTVNTMDLMALFPATVVVLTEAGVDVPALFGSFFGSSFGRDHTAVSRPEALERYLLSCTPNFKWLSPHTALLAWELALVKDTPSAGGTSVSVLRSGVQILEQSWDMPAWTNSILDAACYVEPVGEGGWYALAPGELMGLGGRCTVWSVGPVLAEFIARLDTLHLISDQQSELECLLLEQCWQMGLLRSLSVGQEARRADY